MPSLLGGLQVAVPPPYFRCPISLEIMRDPVSLCTGVTYDRESIEQWLDNGNNTCPATMQALQNQELTPNHMLRQLIQNWCVANRSNGVERIPTPKPPAEPQHVRLLLEDVTSRNGRVVALKSLRTLAKASDRNRRCIAGENVIPILIDLVGTEISDSDREVTEALEEALGMLVLFSLDEGHKRALLNSRQLRSIVWLLNRSITDVRVNAALLLEILAVDRSAMVAIGTTNGAIEGLIQLLHEGLYPTAAKAGLKALLVLCPPFKNRIKMVEMQVIPALVELLPGADRGMIERIMAALDALCASAEGRAAVHGHALAIPALVKNLILVSDITTDHALGALWSVCTHSAQYGILREVVQLDAFRKLLLLVQMDCAPGTRRKAKDLLKLLSQISGEAYCTSEEICAA